MFELMCVIALACTLPEPEEMQVQACIPEMALEATEPAQDCRELVPPLCDTYLEPNLSWVICGDESGQCVPVYLT